MLGLAPGFALAGAQQYEALSASVRASLAKAVSDRQFARLEDPESRAWVRAMHPRVHERVRDERLARELLEMVRYEALRAGLEPRLVLAVIDVESAFRKYAVSTAGARGYMQVMPFWVREIGMPGQNLFHAAHQPALRLRDPAPLPRRSRTGTSRTPSAATTAASGVPSIRSACCT